MTSPHKYYNQCKGILYLRECDVKDIAEFEDGLNSKYDIAEVTKADYIKASNDYTTPLLLTFNNNAPIMMSYVLSVPLKDMILRAVSVNCLNIIIVATTTEQLIKSVLYSMSMISIIK